MVTEQAHFHGYLHAGMRLAQVVSDVHKRIKISFAFVSQRIMQSNKPLELDSWRPTDFVVTPVKHVKEVVLELIKRKN
jgi:hypothetical protein